RRRAATIIEAEAGRLERLVADLLDLARLDAKEFSLHPRPVDVADVVTTTAEGLAPAAREAGLQLVSRGPGRPVPAVLDAQRRAQVVANLVENAITYAVSTVDVCVEPSDEGRIRISVTDDGPG